jgi:hypothetical protein
MLLHGPKRSLENIEAVEIFPASMGIVPVLF